MSAGTRTRRTAAATFTGAAALAVATLWGALVDAHVLVPAPPESADPETALRDYWTWYADGVPAMQVGQLVLLVGLAALVLTVVRVGHDRGTLARPAAQAVVAGSLLWAIATCVRLGSDRAIALLATHDNPIEATSSIAFALSWIAGAFEAVGSLCAGVGIVAATLHGGARRALGVATGVGLVALGVCAYVPLVDARPWLQLVVGTVLLPGWMVAIGVDLRRGRPAVPVSPGAV